MENLKKLGDEPINATPYQDSNIGELYCDNTGLTKREYFSAMAMMGICGDGIAGAHHTAKQTALDSVMYADALLKELDK